MCQADPSRRSESSSTRILVFGRRFAPLNLTFEQMLTQLQNALLGGLADPFPKQDYSESPGRLQTLQKRPKRLDA